MGSRLGSITARHSSSGRQPNSATLNRGCHLYSAGQPSRWALAHILVTFCVFTFHIFCVILDQNNSRAVNRGIVREKVNKNVTKHYISPFVSHLCRIWRRDLSCECTQLQQLFCNWFRGFDCVRIHPFHSLVL